MADATGIKDLATALRGRIIFAVAPDIDRSDSEELERVGRLVELNFLAILLIPFFMLVFFVLAHPAAGTAIAGAGLVMLCSLGVYRLTSQVWLARDLFLVTLLVFKVWETQYFGTIFSPGVAWFTTIPVVAVLLGGTRSGSIWLVIALLALVFCLARNGSSPLALDDFSYRQLFAFSLACVIFALFVFVLMAELGRRKAVGALQSANCAMQRLAERDPLTGLYNRRYVWETLARLTAGEGHGVWGVLLVDVDHFKSINDRFGHAAGDQVLVELGRVIEAAVPATDIVGRYGGEEFVALTRGFENAPEEIAETLRLAVAQMALSDIPQLKGVSVSVGLALHLKGEAFSETLARADRSLYAAKRNGRNCVGYGQYAVRPTG